MTEVEDVWAVVRERNSLRTKVRRLEAENRRLQTIISSYTQPMTMKADDVSTPDPRSRSSAEVW